MLIAGFPAGPWGTNCYVAATGPGTECVVVDPGKDATDGVQQVVREHNLKPVAVLVTFRTPYAEREVSEIMFSGDLLFAGSIGRTDLPGGDHPTMLRSLRDKVLPLRDDIVVLPGHGEQTSIGRERATNPFLLDLLDEGAPTSPVTRGL